MKKICILIGLVAAVCGVATAKAQVKERGVFVEMDFGYGAPLDGYGIFTPTVGYRLTDRWAVGLRASFETAGDLMEGGFKSVGAIGQYRMLGKRRFSLFVEGQAIYTFAPDEQMDGSGPRKVCDDYAEAGFTLGGSCALTRRLSLQARYLYLGYSGSPAFRRSGGCWGDGDFVLDAGWNRLQVGLQYTF